jgi:hypothetical protein
LALAVEKISSPASGGCQGFVPLAHLSEVFHGALAKRLANGHDLYREDSPEEIQRQLLIRMRFGRKILTGDSVFSLLKSSRANRTKMRDLSPSQKKERQHQVSFLT